jgi:hypothetical protein
MICHTKGTSTNTIPCSCHQGLPLILFVYEHRSLNCLRDDKTNHLPMILELVIKMPITCKKNNFGPKEIINGTLGSCHWLPVVKNAITHHQAIDESSRHIVLVSSTLLEVVFIKLLGHDQV